MAFPSSMIGKWTTHKGNCKENEYKIEITKNSYNTYESFCKLQKTEKVLDTDYKFSLVCDDEGETNKMTVFIVDPATPDQLKFSTSLMKSNEHAWMFRCKR